jgi:hypothetical protein
MRSTLEFLEIGRKACLEQKTELPGPLQDDEIKAALQAADLLAEVEKTVTHHTAARLYYYERAIEKAKQEVDKSSVQTSMKG